jgi:enamine deaminase RidA (YjgF/YER057c/UK114 family)
MDRQHFPLSGAGAGTGMSAAVRFGDCIAVAGQVALDADNQLVGRGDVAAQVEQCFDNLAEILARAGASLSDVVQLTTYLTSPAHAGAFLAARGRRFPVNPPATTTVVVARLLGPDFLVEIQALAALS